MKLIWTKSNAPLSLLIRLITGEDCSHFAFVFESKAQALVFESNLMGCHPLFLGSMTSGLWAARIVHQVTLPLSIADEDAIWDSIVQRYDGKGYDFLGAFYLGWRVVLKRLFGLAIPDQNRLSSAGTYYCDELYNVLTQIPAVPQVQVSGAMKTPHALWLALGGKS